MNRPDIPALARGRWPEILTGLGIDPAHLRNHHGPCPGCGGTDRFRFDDRDGRGTFICGRGGDPIAGDGFDLLGHVFGFDAKQAFQAVAHLLGIESGEPPPVQPPRAVPKTEPARPTANYARELWACAARSDEVVGAHPYALRKGINWAAGAGRGTVTGRVVGKAADCLLVPIRDIRTDGVVAVQAINADGDKQTFGPVKGHAFVCGNTLNRRIPWYVCEGWADAVSLVFHRHRGNAASFGCMGSHFDAVAQVVVEHFAPERLCIVGDAV